MKVDGKAIYNKRMRYRIPKYESILAKALYNTFDDYQGKEYEDGNIKILPYYEDDFDKPGFIWVNVYWKPDKIEYSYVKRLGNGTLETSSRNIESFNQMIEYIEEGIDE